MQQKKSSKTYLLTKLIRFIFFVLIFLILIYIFFFYFKINEIDIELNNKKYSILGTELLIDKNILLISENKIKKIILERNPQIEKLFIYKKYPNKLSIKIVLSKPFVQLQSNNGFFLLTNKGKIIQKQKSEFLNIYPKVNYYQKFDYYSSNVGDYLNYKDINYAISFADKINEKGMNVVSIDIASPVMIRLLLGDSVVYLTSEKNIEVQNVQLEKIIEQFKIEGKSFSSLDLRFNKPIIKLK